MLELILPLRVAILYIIDVSHLNMARDDENIEMQLQPMVKEERDQKSHCCDVRRDDSGFWNACKAWYLIVLHLAMCIILLVCLDKFVDEKDFRIGSGPSSFTVPLYQSQVTGLISVSLVLIRTLTGVCSTLIAWRIIFVMLNRGDITLGELLCLQNYRLPHFPRRSLGYGFFWSSWAASVIILTWPSGFAAPLVSSAVTWRPGNKLSKPMRIQTQVLDEVNSHDWAFLFYSDQNSKIIISAASMAGTDPAYAFGPNKMLFRRYFSAVDDIPVGSLIDITMPYFNVDLHWIDGADEIQFQHIGDPEYSDIIHSGINWRGDGSVSILRNITWNKDDAKPKAAEVFSGKRIVSVKVTTLDSQIPLSDGSIARQNMTCPTNSLFRYILPNVTQRETQYYQYHTNDTSKKIWLGKDCFIVAEASITAGIYQGNNCIVNPVGKNTYGATCSMQNPRDQVKADWLSSLSIDFMSEIMRNVVMLNTTSPWIHNSSAGDYTTSMLHLAYDAAWSSMTISQGKDTDSAFVRLAKPIIRAQLEHSRMYIWLGLCGTLTLSAVLLAWGLKLSSTKTIRDPTLAALSVDLSDIAHGGQANGLCNAVTLSQTDKNLPKLRFANDDGVEESDKCRRRVVFADRL